MGKAPIIVCHLFLFTHLSSRVVELCSHGVYYIILHDSYRSDKAYLRASAYVVSKNDTWWEGKLTIPGTYLPPGVTKFNAAAQHGQTPARHFEVLRPQDPAKHPFPDL